MKKKDIHISDAIPAVPASFDAAVERALQKVCKTPRKSTLRVIDGDSQKKSDTRMAANRATRIGLVSAAAVLVLCTFGIGALIIARGLQPRDDSADQPVASPSATAIPQEDEIGSSVPGTSDAPVPAIRYNGMLYCISGTDGAYAGEVAESAIRKAEALPVPASQWPAAEGQTNFGDQPASYAMTIDGLIVLYGGEWRQFEPLLPDTSRGVFEAAYAQVLLERYEYDRTYDARRAKMETMSEVEAQDYDTIMEGEENFLHQRFVRLQRINEVTASVEQEVDRMRLSEIAYLDGRLYFAFAASKVWTFDAEPEIRIKGTQYHAIDDSGFFALKETETEQYAFYEIEPGTLSGTVQITVKNNDHTFRFMYNVEDRTVALSQDEATPQSDVSYYFLVNSVPVYPYEGFLWESKPELEADGMGVRLEDEEVLSQIPVTEYSTGMPFVVLTADGWKLDEIIVFDAAYERVVDVVGSGIPWKEGYGNVATDLLQTLSPGTYYVSAIVSYRTENYSIGNEIAICLQIGAGVPAMYILKDEHEDRIVPYQNFLWEDKDGLAADGMSIFYNLKDERIRGEIPEVSCDPDASFEIAITEGWELNRIVIYTITVDTTAQIARIERGELAETESGYAAPVKTLLPGTYYLSTVVSHREGKNSQGYECVICLHIDTAASDRPAPKPQDTPASEAQLPAMFVSEGWSYEPYVLRSDRVDPKRLGSISAMPIVAYYDDFSIDSPTGVKCIDVYDTEGEPVMLDQPDTECLKTLSPGYYRLVVKVTGTDHTEYACICTLEVKKTPCLFLVNGMIIPPYENFLWKDKDGLAADGMSIFYELKDERIRGEIPYSVFFANTSFEIKPGNDWTLDQIVIYQINGDQVEQLAHIKRSELAETESGYAAPQALKTLSPGGTYYLSAVVSHREGRSDSRGFECVIELQIAEESSQPTPMPPQSATPVPEPALTLQTMPPTTLVPTPTPSEEPNPEHIPMICYGDEVYGLHREECPDTPDENAASGTVTSVVPIFEIPETDGQANFGSVGLRFYVTRDGLVVWYNNAWRLFVAIEFGHEG